MLYPSSRTTLVLELKFKNCLNTESGFLVYSGTIARSRTQFAIF